MRLHLWLGLGFGALLVLAGLTGSILVYYVEIDAWLHPEVASPAVVSVAGLDRAALTVRDAFPDKTGPWRIEVTGRSGALPLRYYHPPETAGRDHAPMLVWLSADGSRVLRRDFWGDTAMTWVYDLHYQWLLGKTAGKIFGYLALLLLALLLTGLWVWWPRGSWRKALHFKANAVPSRRWRDIHKWTGLLGLPLLLLLVGTGVLLVLPEERNALLAPVLGAAQSASGPAPLVANPLPTQPPSAAVAATLRALPAATIAWVELPPVTGGPYHLRVQLPGDPSRRFPRSHVWVDSRTGAVLEVVDGTQSTALTTMANWLHPLHDGSAGGSLLRWLVVLAGLLPAVLFWTGIRRWWARQRLHLE